MKNIQPENPLPLTCSDENAETELQCSAAFDAVVDANSIMFMPGGIQTITPAGGGIEKPIAVLVDSRSAIEIDAQREGILASGRKPFFDFNHDDATASFWPEKFFWKGGDKPGVYASGERSKSGNEAIQGKDYRYFSPVFHVDNKRANPARIINAFDRFSKVNPNMGGLVNNPSFVNILPLSAKNAPGAQSGKQKENQNIMLTAEELAALQAKVRQQESELTELKAKDAELRGKKENNALVASEVKAKEAELKADRLTLENEDLKAKDKKHEEKHTARATKDAQAAVADAVARGAIAAKDEDSKKQWEKLCAENPDNIALLAKQAGNPALGGGRMTSPGVIVVGTKPAEVLRGLGAIMAKQKDCRTMDQKSEVAREALAIYAKEIASNKDVLEMPISAADNTDGNLGILSGTLVAMRTIEDYEQQLIAPQFLTTDYSDVPGQFGQTTVTRIVVTPAVETYDPTLDASGYPKGWVVSTPAQTVDAPVTLNRHKGVPIVFDSNTLGSTVRNLFGEQANLAAYALAKDTNDALLALLTAGNFPGVAAGANTPGTLPEVVAQADFGRPAFAKASAGFNVVGVPIPGRYALLNSLYFEQLSQDPTLVSLAVFQKPEIITGAELPAISKFQPLEAPNLPVTGNLAAFFGHKSALVIQTRLPQDYTKVLPGASFGNVSVITGKTGMSVLLIEYVDHKGGYSAWRIALMSGVAKGNPKGGKIITSA